MPRKSASANLAIEGGEPVRAEKFPPRIMIGDAETEAVLSVLDRCRTQGGAFDRYGGAEVDAYEQEFAAFHGMKFATATSSGTAAIHTALGALRLDVGQEIISAPITDPGAVFPILWMNCIPIFADADPRTMNVSARSIEARITDKTRAVIVAHIAGQPCDMGAIMKVAKRHDLLVIEDCSQSHGAKYRGRRVGTFGQMAAYSLMSGKHTTAGGQGGMVLTNNEDLYWQCKRFADRGKPFNAPDAHDNLFMGMNYRMTELQAAVGRVQLKKTDEVAAARRAIVARLERALKPLSAVTLGYQIPGAYSTYWFLLLRFHPEKVRVDKETFVRALVAEGLPCDSNYGPAYNARNVIVNRLTYGQSGCPWICPFYGREVDYTDACPDAERACRDHFLIYFHECWTEREVADVAAALTKVEKAYLKRRRSS
jgi:perosamine synthetase